MPFAHRVVALVIAMTCTGVAKAEPVSLPAANTPSRAQAAPGDEAHARTTSSFSESNETSSRRQATFNERIARRGERAIASLCNGCGTDASRQKPRATNPVNPMAGAIMPDAESIYSRKRGFDPSRAASY
ncbi:hypothetical protein ACYQOP_26255 [Methylobacterium sp. CM6247]